MCEAVSLGFSQTFELRPKQEEALRSILQRKDVVNVSIGCSFVHAREFPIIAFLLVDKSHQTVISGPPKKRLACQTKLLICSFGTGSSTCST